MVPESQREGILGYFDRRFGISLSAFSDYRLLERRKAYLIVRDTSHLERLAFLKVQTVGLPVLRKIRNHLKPTTAALQRFGHLATRHQLDLDAQQAMSLLQSGELVLHIDCSPGYVVLTVAGHVLGCALYTPGRLRSQIPRRLIAPQRVQSSVEVPKVENLGGYAE